MKHRPTVFQAAILGFCIPFFLYALSQYQDYQALQQAYASYTFTNTQVWNQKYIDEMNAWPQIVRELALPTPPPENTSRETKRELQALHALVDTRTVEKSAEIKREMTLPLQLYAGVQFYDLVHPFEKPQSYQLIMQTNQEFRIFLLRAKSEYNRVRPSYLDPALTTVIAVPGHPAYPSGHASESYLIALLLSVLDPANAEDYMASADRIAHNREIAGVHYASDSRAGQVLAQAYFDALRKTAWYEDMVAAAIVEWD